MFRFLPLPLLYLSLVSLLSTFYCFHLSSFIPYRIPFSHCLIVSTRLSHIFLPSLIHSCHPILKQISVCFLSLSLSLALFLSRYLFLSRSFLSLSRALLSPLPPSLYLYISLSLSLTHTHNVMPGVYLEHFDFYKIAPKCILNNRSNSQNCNCFENNLRPFVLL